jgi:hypothetical protein
VAHHHRTEKLFLPLYELNARNGSARSNGTIQHEDSGSHRRPPSISMNETSKSAETGTGTPSSTRTPMQSLQ